MNKPAALMFFYANAQRVCQMGLGNVRLMVAGRQGVAQLQGTVKLLQVDGGARYLRHAVLRKPVGRVTVHTVYRQKKKLR